MEQAKDEQTGLQDYKLCYVSNASDVNFVKRQISNAITLAIYKKDIKTEKVSISKIFRYNGKSYLFYFINKGTLDLLDENNTISNDIASFNSQLEYNIATGGFHTMQQKSKKINDNFLKMVNHTVYINHDEKICPLNEVLLASGELKGDEASRKTFLDCFADNSSLDMFPYRKGTIAGGRVAKINVPLLVLFGNTGDFILQEINEIKRMYEEIELENCIVQVIEGANHSYKNCEQELSESILTWLEEIAN